MSILFITHDIYYLCDRMLVMYRGELIEVGTVEEAVRKAEHEYTQRLLNDVPKLHGDELMGEPASSVATIQS